MEGESYREGWMCILSVHIYNVHVECAYNVHVECCCMEKRKGVYNPSPSCLLHGPI